MPVTKDGALEQDTSVNDAILYRTKRGDIAICEFCKTMYTCESCPACKTINPPKIGKYHNYKRIQCEICEKSKSRECFDTKRGSDTGKEDICKVCKKKSR